MKRLLKLSPRDKRGVFIGLIVTGLLSLPLEFFYAFITGGNLSLTNNKFVRIWLIGSGIILALLAVPSILLGLGISRNSKRLKAGGVMLLVLVYLAAFLYFRGWR
ncbi:MAG: hypothetical protein PHR56_01500 [Dehalococcoidales bacterium]|nr:hypothetical protein [Dehalococcoidales bacterium]